MRSAQPMPYRASELAQRKEHFLLIGTKVLCLLWLLQREYLGRSGNLGLFGVEMIIKTA